MQKRRNARERQTFITRAWHKKVCKFYTVDKTSSVGSNTVTEKAQDTQNDGIFLALLIK
jgi:hypothetical protein